MSSCFHIHCGECPTSDPPGFLTRPVAIDRVIQEESARLREMIVCVILSTKVHINMCPILDVYGGMGIF